MIINLVYLTVGLLIGFLIKHEVDIKQRQKRIMEQQRIVAQAVVPYDETLAMVKELNENLLSIHKERSVKKQQEA